MNHKSFYLDQEQWVAFWSYDELRGVIMHFVPVNENLPAKSRWYFESMVNAEEALEEAIASFKQEFYDGTLTKVHKEAIELCALGCISDDQLDELIGMPSKLELEYMQFYIDRYNKYCKEHSMEHLMDI